MSISLKSISFKSIPSVLKTSLSVSFVISYFLLSYSTAQPVEVNSYEANSNNDMNQLAAQQSDANNIDKETQLLVDYFFAAARTGDVEVLTQFIEAGFPIDHRNSQSYTALMVSAYNGQAPATSALLDLGANACLQDKRGNTAIMGAVIKAEFTIIKQLYRHECDAKLTNKSGMTLNDFAEYWGQSDKLASALLSNN
ncbi:ankyrin repeat domain-containing protein [Shewanella sp. TC10]|uniref:ankyrin repeat domain-containing protein n=1 Tax=Shewanella sp. TC10 TaxID=1419739 RepID=UPI00129D3C4F|nr:ankyrin repeat domain-containing protein [Shewanella sp. TC10]